MDYDKVTEFLGQFVADLGATGAAGSVVIGHRLGLYRALAQGPATPEQFAERTGCHPRYLTEWLRGQAAGGYVSYDPATGAFSLTEEQAFCLADPNGPNVSAAFFGVLAYLRAEPRITEAFRTGAGVGWHEHDSDVFVGIDAILPARLRGRAGTSWIPALDGCDAKLTARGSVADRLRSRLSAVLTRRGLSRYHRRLGLPRRVDRTGAQEAAEAGVTDRRSASGWPPRRPSPARTTTL
jgi:hypothetical protein